MQAISRCKIFRRNFHVFFFFFMGARVRGTGAKKLCRGVLATHYCAPFHVAEPALSHRNLDNLLAAIFFMASGDNDRTFLADLQTFCGPSPQNASVMLVLVEQPKLLVLLAARNREAVHQCGQKLGIVYYSRHSP